MADTYTPPLPSFVRCRTLGHAWDTATPTRKPLFGVLMALQCVSCGMIREDILQPDTGELLGRAYHKPLGYKDVGIHSRAEWRVTFIGLATTETAPSENGKKK